MDQKRDPEASEKSAASPVDAAPKARDKHSPDGVAPQSDGSLQNAPAKEPQVNVTPSAPPAQPGMTNASLPRHHLRTAMKQGQFCALVP
jgi:hypothetical protein